MAYAGRGEPAPEFSPFAAARLGASHVDAFDLDPTAVRTAKAER